MLAEIEETLSVPHPSVRKSRRNSNRWLLAAGNRRTSRLLLRATHVSVNPKFIPGVPERRQHRHVDARRRRPSPWSDPRHRCRVEFKRQVTTPVKFVNSSRNKVGTKFCDAARLALYSSRTVCLQLQWLLSLFCDLTRFLAGVRCFAGSSQGLECGKCFSYFSFSTEFSMVAYSTATVR